VPPATRPPRAPVRPRLPECRPTREQSELFVPTCSVSLKSESGRPEAWALCLLPRQSVRSSVFRALAGPSRGQSNARALGLKAGAIPGHIAECPQRQTGEARSPAKTGALVKQAKTDDHSVHAHRHWLSQNLHYKRIPDGATSRNPDTQSFSLAYHVA